MKRIALIGYSAIARILCSKLAEHGAGEVVVAGVLVRDLYLESTRAAVGADTTVVTDIGALIRLTPNLVVECAGQGAVAQYGEAVLRGGLDLMVISTGALAQEALRERLVAAARLTGRQILLPAGAAAGIDGLNAHRIGGLEHVRYISVKPPLAWKGTPAEEKFDLAAITTRTVLYTGPAHEAARLYPKNANLAATVALAGIGMQRTEIQLVADPAVAPYNVGRIEARGRFGEMIAESRALPAPDNPKTSATTALSLAHSILKGVQTVVL